MAVEIEYARGADADLIREIIREAVGNNETSFVITREPAPGVYTWMVITFFVVTFILVLLLLYTCRKVLLFAYINFN